MKRQVYHYTMNICLNEIEICQKTSPYVNFIALLGDRYGWQPLPYEIPEDEFNQIKSIITDEDDRRFLFWEGDVLEEEQLKKREGWYCRDENAVPPVYCLKPRLVDYDEDASDDEIKEARDLEYKDWEDVEKRLKSILLNAIDELGWDNDDFRRFKYKLSATEHEIIKGVLNLPLYISDNCFCYFRNISNLEEYIEDSCNKNVTKDFVDFDENGTINQNLSHKINSLKNELRERVPNKIFEYETKWNGKSIEYNHIDLFCKDVYDHLSNLIFKEERFREEKKIWDIEDEIYQHKQFFGKKERFFINRENILRKIFEYLNSESRYPLLIHGPSGSGKSAIIASGIKNTVESNEVVIISRSVGRTADSIEINSLFISLCQEIDYIFGFEDEYNELLNYKENTEKLKYNINEILTEYSQLKTYDKVVEIFFKHITKVPSNNKLFIFLDGIEKFEAHKKLFKHIFLYKSFPNNVKMVLSLSSNLLSAFKDEIPKENIVRINELSKETCDVLLDTWLDDHKRTLQSNQRENLFYHFSENGTPFYLRLAFEEAKNWKSYMNNVNIEKNIEGIVKNRIKELSVEYGQKIVERTLGYLACSKNGLATDEIIDILSGDSEVYEEFLKNSFHKNVESKLPVVLWSRLYYELVPYGIKIITERKIDDTYLYTFNHSRFKEIIIDEFLNHELKLELNRKLSNYFSNQQFATDFHGKKIYNYRKLSELPYNLTQSEMWDDLVDILNDAEFIETKLNAGMKIDLIEDYERAHKKCPIEYREKFHFRDR